MPPSRIQYCLAHAFKLAICSGALILAILIALGCGGFSFYCIVAILLALLLGCVLGALFLYPILLWISSKINGYPFCCGDVVRILAGRYCGKLCQIYEIWSMRHSVRVNISEQAKKDVTDVFSYSEICRERDVIKLITKEEIFPLLIEASPGFALCWEKCYKEWKDCEAGIPYHGCLGDYARYLIDKFQKEDIGDFPNVFRVVERLLCEGDPYTCDAVLTGLLEGIQNNMGEKADKFIQFILPETKSCWKKLKDYWAKLSEANHAKDRAYRKKYYE